MKYDFNEEISKMSDGKKGGAGWFKIQEGSNRIRIMSKGEMLKEKFNKGVVYAWDKGYPWKDEEDTENGIPRTNIKWLTWIIDRVDGKLKLYKIPYEIMKQIGALQKDPDYQFEELPMPYDITINAIKAGTKEVSYSVVPARSNTPITLEEMEALNAESSTKEIVEKMQEKQIAKHKEEGLWVDPDVRARAYVESTKSVRPTKPMEEPVEYPTEDINPEDIPF